MSILVLSEMEELNEGEEIDTEMRVGDQVLNEEILHLSMNYIVGLTEGKTMKLMGSIKVKRF